MNEASLEAIGNGRPQIQLAVSPRVPVHKQNLLSQLASIDSVDLGLGFSASGSGLDMFTSAGANMIGVNPLKGDLCNSVSIDDKALAAEAAEAAAAAVCESCNIVPEAISNANSPSKAKGKGKAKAKGKSKKERERASSGKACKGEAKSGTTADACKSKHGDAALQRKYDNEKIGGSGGSEEGKEREEKAVQGDDGIYAASLNVPFLSQKIDAMQCLERINNKRSRPSTRDSMGSAGRLSLNNSIADLSIEKMSLTSSVKSLSLEDDDWNLLASINQISQINQLTNIFPISKIAEAKPNNVDNGNNLLTLECKVMDGSLLDGGAMPAPMKPVKPSAAAAGGRRWGGSNCRSGRRKVQRVRRTDSPIKRSKKNGEGGGKSSPCQSTSCHSLK